MRFPASSWRSVRILRASDLVYRERSRSMQALQVREARGALATRRCPRPIADRAAPLFHRSSPTTSFTRAREYHNRLDFATEAAEMDSTTPKPGTSAVEARRSGSTTSTTRTSCGSGSSRYASSRWSPSRRTRCSTTTTTRRTASPRLWRAQSLRWARLRSLGSPATHAMALEGNAFDMTQEGLSSSLPLWPTEVEALAEHG
jgi:hypothetical protein